MILDRLSAELGGGDLRNAHILRMVTNVAQNLPNVLACTNCDMIAAVQSAMQGERIECSPLRAQRLLLGVAVLSVNLAYIQAALENGINDNMVIDYQKGDTLLHFATRLAIATRQLKMVQVLLGHNANYSKLNKSGESPFSLAEIARYEELKNAFIGMLFA